MVDMKAKPFYLSEEDCKWVEETIGYDDRGRSVSFFSIWDPPETKSI